MYVHQRIKQLTQALSDPEVLDKARVEAKLEAYWEIASEPNVRKYTERDVDFAYLCGVFNVVGIDGLKKELDRLKELGLNPHDIIDSLTASGHKN